MAKCLCFQ